MSCLRLDDYILLVDELYHAINEGGFDTVSTFNEIGVQTNIGEFSLDLAKAEEWLKVTESTEDDMVKEIRIVVECIVQLAKDVMRG